MKRILFLVFFFFTLLASHAQRTKIGYVPRTYNSPSSNSQTVYVCTGYYAYAYHSVSNCAGLGNCKGEIKYTDENYAVSDLKRVPCCRCWGNVTNRCKDDNPPQSTYQYYPSSYDFTRKQSNAILGFGSIIGIVPMLSNDLYLYHVSSFNKNIPIDNKDILSFKTRGGLTLGFRKTFDHSALEYGVSYLFSDVQYPWYSFSTSKYGFHFNFVKHVFSDKTPDKLKIYLGPSINYVYKLGYGGIVGTELKLNDRLKLDARYELTNQTNHLQLGLIFTYQKEYIWEF